MIKLKPEVFFFTSYLLIGIFPIFNSLDVNNTQFLFLSFVSLTHFIYNLLKGYNKTNYNVVVFAFFLVYCLSLLSFTSALNISEAIIDSSRLFILFLLFFNVYISTKKDPQLIDLAFKLICFSLLIEVAAVLKIFVEYYNLTIVERIGRFFLYKGIAGNINIAGLSMVLKSTILLYYLQNTSSIAKRLVLGFFMILTMFAISLTGSRGALLSMYVVILIFMFINLKTYLKTKNVRSLYKPLNYIVPFTVTFIITELIFDTLKMSYRTTQIIERGSNSRLAYWSDTIQGILDYPLFGVGIGNWKVFSVAYGKRYIDGYILPHHAHNDFLQIAAEIGIIGGIIFITIPLYIIYSIYKNYIKNNSKNINYQMIFILLAVIVYCADSSLNFPISRPIQSATFFTLIGIASTFFVKHSFDFLDKFFRSKTLTIVIILISISAIFTSVINYQSSIYQKNLFNDYNDYDFDIPTEIVETWGEKFPNLTQTGMPIRALKAHYYYQNGDTLGSIKILKNQPNNDNPFLGVYEGKLGRIYYELDMPDSTYKYSKIAYNKIPRNELHAAYLMSSMVDLNLFDELIDTFHKEKKIQSEGVWYNFIRGVYNPASNYPIDSLRIYLKEGRRLFPDNRLIKLAKQETEYGIANIDQAEVQAQTGSKRLDEGDYETAYKHYYIASQLLPDEFAYRQNMALAKLNLGDYDEALKLMNYAIDSLIVPSDYSRIFAIRGGVHLLLKNLDLACSDFIRGVKKNDELSKEFLLNNCQQFISKVEPVQ